MMQSNIQVTNKAIVQRWFDEIWNQGQLSVADEILAQPDSVKRYIATFRQAFPNIQHRTTDLIADGDKVVAVWTATGVHTGQWHTLAPTNQAVSYSGVTIAQVADGKIISHHTLWDTNGLLEQLGAIQKIRKADGSRL